MSLTKSVLIELLPATWPAPATPPDSLLRAEKAGPYQMDVLFALMFTALWTRPPVRYGFSLADTWAWMRYIPALSSSGELRLCEAWNTLDPHQKTVLSEDFGVGFTTWFLYRELGFLRYSDTLWVINTLQPGAFQLGPSAKRGQQKSPDYIAEDRHGNLSVLECKGTQTSRQRLIDAIKGGIPQKQNLKMVGGGQLTHSLVAGLFIPQFHSAQDPVLIVADPERPSISEVLGRYSRGEIRRGISQIAYAKELATLGFAQTANAVARAKDSLERVDDAFSIDLQMRRPGRSITDDQIVNRREYVWDAPTRMADDLLIEGARFEVTLPAVEADYLRRCSSADLLGERTRDESEGSDWTAEVDGAEAVLKSPMGTTFRLSLLLA